jgi:hypothetical protein
MIKRFISYYKPHRLLLVVDFSNEATIKNIQGRDKNGSS